MTPGDAEAGRVTVVAEVRSEPPGTIGQIVVIHEQQDVAPGSAHADVASARPAEGRMTENADSRISRELGKSCRRGFGNLR
jgi:hypothetical protein